VREVSEGARSRSRSGERCRSGWGELIAPDALVRLHCWAGVSTFLLTNLVQFAANLVQAGTSSVKCFPCGATTWYCTRFAKQVEDPELYL
jgi:hypothetical protein